MNTAAYYLDEIQKKGEFISDYAIAKHLFKVGRQNITGYRKGKTFDDKKCIIVAEYLGLDPMLLIAEMNVQRARSKEDSGFWKATIKKLNSSAATIFGITLALPVLFESVRVYILC